MNMYGWFASLRILATLVGLAVAPAVADETVDVGGSRSVLIRPKAPRASVILMPGAKGAIFAGPNGEINGMTGNLLIRTRNVYASRGFAVLVVDANVNLRSAVEYMAAIKRPVTVIATSRGTVRAAEGMAQGAKPDALVLISGFLSAESGSSTNVMSILGSPALLPRTLLINHREDSCHFTLPPGVEPFLRWAGGRARVVWLSGGQNVGDPCEARAHHGFNGLDGQVAGIAAGFR
jgi:hypothetical protein